MSPIVLAPEFWGKGYVTEAATALLELGFETMGLDLIVSFAVWNNERSIAVMKRIGMRPSRTGISTIRGCRTATRI